MIRTSDFSANALPDGITLASYTSSVIVSKSVTFVLQGNNGSWVTIPGDQYYLDRANGIVTRRVYDDSDNAVDWTSYSSYRATYALYNPTTQATTTKTNEAQTFGEFDFVPALFDPNTGAVNAGQPLGLLVSGQQFTDTIASDNFVAGTSGWQITRDGNAEFENGTFRGTIYATGGQIDGSLIVNGTITADKMNVTTLSAITANLGNVFIGSDLEISTGGALRSGKTSFSDTAAGFYMAYNEGVPVFNIGTETKYLTWDGTNLTTSGNIYLTGGAFTGVVSIDVAGGVYQGTGTFGAPITGLKVWSDGGFGRITSYNGGSLQAGFTSDGKFGAGFVSGVPYLVLDQNGLFVNATFPTPASSVTHNPGTLADDSAVGTVAWSNASNAAASDDSYASVSLSGGGSGDTGATSGGTFANDTTIGNVAWSNPSNAASSDNNRATADLSGTTSANTSATSAGSGSDDASVGEQTWSGTGNITSANGSYATVTLPFFDAADRVSRSHYLKATNFGFSLPTGSTVTGVYVGIKRMGGGAPIYDYSVRLIRGGTILGNDYASGAYWASANTYVYYGGSSDLWGVTLTDSNVNSSSFGVALSVTSASTDNTASVDHFQITIYYTVDANTSQYLKVTNFGFAVPGGATINGIVAEVELSASAGSAVYDNSVKLVKGGTITGSDKKRASSSYWGTSDAYITYGSSGNLWGTTWSVSNINASNFGIVIAAKSNSAVTARIDHVRITVYYTTSGGSQAHYLKASNFGFALPSTATVSGVQVDVEKKAGTASNVTDTVVKLVKGGTVSGSDKSSASAWGTSDAYTSYGGASDLWGVALAYSDINASTFGFVISCSAASVPETAYIDHIRITVYYTNSATVSPIDFNGYGFQNDGQYEYTQGVLFSQTVSVEVKNTTTETTLTGSGRGTLTLPADFLKVGKTLRVTARGIFSTTGTPNLRLRVLLGGSSGVLISTGSFATPSSVTNRGWVLECLVTCYSVGASGTAFSQGEARISTSATDGVLIDATNAATKTIDTTSALALDVVAMWGTARNSNTITCTNLIVEAVG